MDYCDPGYNFKKFFVIIINSMEIPTSKIVMSREQEPSRESNTKFDEHPTFSSRH